MNESSASARVQPELTAHTRRIFLERCQPDPATGCILWTGAVRTRSKHGTRGYGVIGVRGWTLPAHHVAWILAHGSLPEDPELEVGHLCEVLNCVNVEHLEWVTSLENWRRYWERRVECLHGHDWQDLVPFFRGHMRVCFSCPKQGKKGLAATRNPRKALRRHYCQRGHDVSGQNGYEIAGLPHIRGCHICTERFRKGK